MPKCNKCGEDKPLEEFYDYPRFKHCRTCRKASIKKKYATKKGNLTLGNHIGHGRLDFPDGAYYEGEFKDGKRHGKGVFVFADGRRVPGVWKEGVLDCEK